MGIMPARITPDQLLRHTLAAQCLDARSDDPDVVAMAGRVGGLHATDHLTPYLSLLARIEDFRPEQLTAAWLRERRLDRRRVMRGTLHVVPTERLPVLGCALAPRSGELPREVAALGLDASEERRVAEAILAVLGASGPQTVAGLRKLVPAELQRTLTDRYAGRYGVVTVVTGLLWDRGLLVQGIERPGPDGWRTAPVHYLRAADAFGDEVASRLGGGLKPCDRAAADRSVARWYFAAHGPASAADWAWWSGLPASRAGPALRSIAPELAEVEVVGRADRFLLPAAELDELHERLDAPPAGVRVLPYEDNALKGYRATRDRFFDPAGIARERAFNRFGEALPTILVGGRITGTWVWKERRSIAASLFAAPDGPARAAIEEELARVAAFLGASEVELRAG